MPTNADGAELLLDTSAAIAFSVADLVGAVARERDLPLATRDRRALETYGALGVRVELL